jgi:hypothetical protein
MERRRLVLCNACGRLTITPSIVKSFSAQHAEFGHIEEAVDALGSVSPQ